MNTWDGEWIDSAVALPPLTYNADMDYWYSVKVLTDNGYEIKVRTLMSTTGVRGSFGSCLGGQPKRWKYL